LGENVADLASSSSLATGCHGSKEIVGSPEVVNELQKTKTKALKMGSNVSCLLFLLFYDGFLGGFRGGFLCYLRHFGNKFFDLDGFYSALTKKSACIL
jgi:hypothetical protein